MDINSYKNNKKKNKNNNKVIVNYIINYCFRIMICIVLILFSLIIFKSHKKYKDLAYKYIYEKNFSFSYFHKLYDKYLGGVLPLDNIISTEKVFKEKITYKSSKKYKDGFKLEVDNKYLVPSIDSGIVVYMGEKDHYGNVVIVQQNNGIDVWYGNVTSSLSMYDYVEKGELIGESKSDFIYLVLEKDGKYLDYKDYI